MREFNSLIQRQSNVVGRADAVRLLGEAAIRWRLKKGWWQRPWPGVIVTHNGPLTPMQELWVAVTAAGRGAVLAGLTAATLDGLMGFNVGKMWILLPTGRQVKLGAKIRAHRSKFLLPEDVHPLRTPPRTRMPRSIVDACQWAASADQARLILAASVQQRLVRTSDVRAVLDRLGRVRHGRLIAATLDDVELGSHSIPELEVVRLIRAYSLPMPDRQVIRHDASGRPRWLDLYYDDFRLVVEIDGRWHMDAVEWWRHMERQNDLVIQRDGVLRFPSFALREHPEEVARQLARALLARGWVPLVPLRIAV